MSRIRCFVAADLPAELREDLARLQGRLRSLGVAARWVKPESIHLTVKFLGELDPSAFAAVFDVLDAPLEMAGPLRLTARGLGAFPSARRARVVWVGLEGDVASLTKAVFEVEARLETVGIAKERRPFRPHLTVGRARRGGDLRGMERAMAAEGGYGGPEFAVTELVLYESQLRPQGAEYTPRLSVPLS